MYGLQQYWVILNIFVIDLKIIQLTRVLSLWALCAIVVNATNYWGPLLTCFFQMLWAIWYFYSRDVHLIKIFGWPKTKCCYNTHACFCKKVIIFLWEKYYVFLDWLSGTWLSFHFQTWTIRQNKIQFCSFRSTICMQDKFHFSITIITRELLWICYINYFSTGSVCWLKNN